MSKVFVVQSTHRWDDEAKMLVPKFDVGPAREYGHLVFLLGSNAAPFNSAPVIEELKHKLSEITEQDYLLLMGNPALIGFAATIAANTLGGKLRLLQWSGKERRYLVVEGENLFTF